MNSKPLYTLVIALVAVVLLVGACSAGFLGGMALAPSRQGSNNTPVGPASDGTSQPQGTDELFVPFWEAWQIVHDYYLEQPVDDTKLMQGAIRGMLESLGDQHSGYMDPQQYKDANADLTGYEGIGAFVNTEGEYLTIVEPISGSPAEAAGLVRGDQVIAIDGVDMTGTLPEAARMKVLGPAGTSVTLTILREGVEEPFDVTITRAKIIVPSVEYEMLEGNVAYIRLNSFSDTSVNELHAALEDLLAQEPVGLILDLRNNGGGFLTSAIDIGSEFIPEGVIAYEEYGDGTRDTYNASGDGIAYNIPMVVLVNEYSASASELVAGALQDYGRATLVGVTTFGKGSVQNWIPLSDEQGAVRVTIARWLTPKERWIHEVGLVPEYVVELTDEDLAAGNDPQLQKAIELLTNK